MVEEGEPSKEEAKSAKNLATVEGFRNLYAAAYSDVEHAFTEVLKAEQNGKPDHRLRRNATRALFAWIEAMVGSMKRTALVFDDDREETVFTPEQISVLEEREPFLDD